MKRKKKLKWKHIAGILKFLITIIPAKIASIFIKDLWLVQEDDNEARDNGYWMFKYIRENHPEQKCYYVLNKTSPDYEKVAKLGKIIKPHSFKHWWHYIIASKVISSQTGGKPCPAFVNKMENLGLFKTKTYFLQHGITVNDVGWLYHKFMKVKMFLTTTSQEDAFIKEKFGHPEQVVQYLGFPRFDNLHNDITDKDMILVMPSWRNYINNAGVVLDGTGSVGSQNFLDSDYFKKWSEFINSKQLDEFLIANDKTLYFYPHRNTQPFIDHFSTSSKRVVTSKRANEDVQNLLRKCSMIITDYSSVIFDVLYQNKPVITYQFDEESFRAGQYAKGYFDYHTNPMIHHTNDLNGVFKHLNQLKKNNFKCGKDELNEIHSFFSLRDNQNCKRVYEFIKQDKK